MSAIYAAVTVINSPLLFVFLTMLTVKKKSLRTELKEETMFSHLQECL